jgi:hypothetical protein
MRLIRYIPIAALLLSNTSWSQVGSKIQSGPPISGRALDFPSDPLPSPAENAPIVSPDSALRQQYLDLAKARSELMSQDSLKQEIAATQKNINELRALQRLQEAQEILQSLAADFPDSAAGLKATQMLNAVGDVGLRASFPDDIGPALNTAAEEPFQRSPFAREVPPLIPHPEKESDLPVPAFPPRVSFPVPKS